MSTNKPKITPGKWKAHGFAVYQADQWKDGNNLGGRHIFSSGVPCDMDLDDERAANADLAAEAGTVANETGLWPREMAEQREELRDICQAVLLLDSGNHPELSAVQDEIRSALAAAAPLRPTAPKP